MKKFLSIVFAALFAGLAFAMPGIPYTDNSGDYVYYRDYSFNRESYIGFLTYDSGTYAARYFAPATEDLAPRNIELLFTVDPDKDYIDMTGERFVTQPTPDDTEIINYIHDLIYEFASRAKKVASNVNSAQEGGASGSVLKKQDTSVFMNSGNVSKQDFSQFGGEVFIFFDDMIPVFPVKKILSNSQEVLFEAICIGRIIDSEDRSFSDFQIPHNEIKDENFNHKIKKPKAVTYETEGTKITLDENWQCGVESAENLFFYDGEAMVYIRKFDDEIGEWEFIKSILKQVQGSYNPLSDVSILKEKQMTTVCLRCYSNNSVFERFVLFREKDGQKIMLNMVVNEKQYDENRKYYRNILKSWK